MVVEREGTNLDRDGVLYAHATNLLLQDLGEDNELGCGVTAQEVHEELDLDVEFSTALDPTRVGTEDRNVVGGCEA